MSDLDGVVTAPKGAQVFAYGQAFFDQGSRFVAGIHDVHCATHRGADNGWVVVNGAKSTGELSLFHSVTPGSPCRYSRMLRLRCGWMRKLPPIQEHAQDGVRAQVPACPA